LSPARRPGRLVAGSPDALPQRVPPGPLSPGAGLSGYRLAGDPGLSRRMASLPSVSHASVNRAKVTVL